MSYDDDTDPSALFPDSSSPVTAWQPDQGGTANPQDAPADDANLLVRGALGYYTPLSGSGTRGQSEADGGGPPAIFDDMVDHRSYVPGLPPPGAIDDPMSQTQDRGPDATPQRLRQFSFDEDPGAPPQLPDWANDQRFGMQEKPPTVDGEHFDDLSGDIYRGIPNAPPTTYGDGRRPWADDFLANYDQEATDANSKNGPRPQDVYSRAGGNFAREAATVKNPDDLNSCALRVSKALDLAGGVNGPYAIPVDPNDHLSIDGNQLLSYDTADSKLPDGSKAKLGYISQAKEMDTYLQHTWGPPDLSLDWDMQHDTEESMKAKVDAIQKSLAPGEAAVFARDGHTGVITPDYMDRWAHWMPLGKMDFWILRPKPQ